MKIKSFLTKALTGLMTLCIISGTGVTAFAAELDEFEGENPAIISELGEIDPDDPGDPDNPVDFYWDHPDPFSFHGSNAGNNRYADYRYLAYELKLTSSQASYVTVEVKVDGVIRSTANIPCDGVYHKVDWIDMQYSGNHTVQWIYTASTSGAYVEGDLIYYSWN